EFESPGSHSNGTYPPLPLFPTQKTMFKLASAFVLAAFAAAGVMAEQHTVHFSNNCGFGTPTLIQGPNVLSTGGDFTSNGPLISAIAYLQTGSCGFNGEGCTLVELTLTNGFSSADISLIPPHAFSVTSGFGHQPELPHGVLQPRRDVQAGRMPRCELQPRDHLLRVNGANRAIHTVPKPSLHPSSHTVLRVYISPMFKLAPAFVLAALAATGVMAEQHTVTVVNNCGYGTPTFTNAGNVVTTGASFLFSQATAVYLQNGSCGPNGERCTAVHLAQASTLGLSYRISVTPPNAYTVPVSVHFYNGCEGQGAECKQGSFLPRKRLTRRVFPQGQRPADHILPFGTCGCASARCGCLNT
ncbi:unnamed protein product, partial [Mycena citricolor]